MSGKLSDSPWFWLLMFGAAAVAALAVIGPKHVRRQQRLVRMQAARERVQTATAKAADSSQPAAEDSVQEAVEQPHVSVRPLMAFLASALFIAALVAGWIQVRTPPASRAPPPNEVTG
jgi:hypothetical protein